MKRGTHSIEGRISGPIQSMSLVVSSEEQVRVGTRVSNPKNKNCDLCGEAHESYQAHRFPTVNASEVMDNAATTWITPVANAKKASYRYRDPEKRREYMRELMRKRRAA
jgi:hypothetical protein